ncbi:unnamed protein product [Euphydryas editha]|uniref:WD repeat-containing protein 60 n=1 Tax=Euphydryas editha TaxID=104508 RepID=A0AAU9UTP9_EUPED|nr:unnamed protein product [Euphydryas editha]
MNPRKTTDKKTKDDPKKQDEKTKRTLQNISTPRNVTQKSTADIYSRTNSAVKAPRKSSNKVPNISPMKDILKSSPSSVSQNTSRSFKTGNTDTSKTVLNSARSTEKHKLPAKSITNKTLPVNITVNSPIVKRKLDVSQDKLKRIASKDVVSKSKEDSSKKVLIPERQRSNTRTLDEAEIKMLTPDAVDNNAELFNLTKKLNAKPKAFYVNLNEDKKPRKEKSSDEEISYEDDFESYESDFDSYHSEGKNDSTGDDLGDETHDETNDESNDDDGDENKTRDFDKNSNISDNRDIQVEDEDVSSKEERMLDSGNYELRDSRSANKTKPMDFISEASEEEVKTLKYSEENDKKVSLTDEGFQDMSSGLSSIRTVHVDVLERPLFIDFTKSKENRRKRRIFEKLKQRAKDILNMVTLHEIAYNLYEMAPIPYDLYMATFGRYNYKQTAVQTFDDGITEEVQTEVILYANKWTQCPVEFSNNDIYLNANIKKISNNDLDDFVFDTEEETKIEHDDQYKSDPLRIFLEQKDGVGPDKIMPIETYKRKIKDNSYNVKRLRKFLKKVESRISNILSRNTGNTDLSNLIRTSKFPFSIGYLSLSTKKLDNFLRNSKIISTTISETKSNLIITIHKKFKSGFVAGKCVLCLWDLSVANREPLKILISTDNIKIGRFSGSTDGYFVGALEDGSIQLWDLTEQPTWSNDVAIEEKSTKIKETETKKLSQTERDREWNLKNSTDFDDKQNQGLLQACSYTSSAMAVCNNESVDTIVGLEFVGDTAANSGSGRKIIRQVCSLQRTGILTIWSIVQEKTQNTDDLGKAFWSKLKLEKNQTINLTEHINIPINSELPSFNLNAAKKRLTIKRQEKIITKISRPKSTVAKSNVDRPNSAASAKNKVLTDNYIFNFWENGVVFNHLKVMKLNNINNYLVAKNYGEVLCCKRNLGTVKVKNICVANAASSVTHLESSPHGLPYFLAGTDAGTVNVCSLTDFRVLLTLECGTSPTAPIEKCKSDDKGRFISSVPVQTSIQDINAKLTINSISWSHTNPFNITAVCNTSVSVWELTHSDMRAWCTGGEVLECCSTERALVLLTTEGEVQFYKLKDEERKLELFKKYISLL